MKGYKEIENELEFHNPEDYRFLDALRWVLTPAPQNEHAQLLAACRKLNPAFDMLSYDAQTVVRDEVIRNKTDTPAPEVCECGHHKTMHSEHGCDSEFQVSSHRLAPCPCTKYTPAKPLIQTGDEFSVAKDRSCENCGNEILRHAGKASKCVPVALNETHCGNWQPQAEKGETVEELHLYKRTPEETAHKYPAESEDDYCSEYCARTGEARRRENGYIPINKDEK